MKVKAKINNSFIIKDKWYDVIGERETVSRENSRIYKYYKIKNNLTDKISKLDDLGSWFLSEFFYNVEEVRDLKIDEIIQK